MVFLVIDKKCANTIYTCSRPEIEMVEFETKDEAEYYLRHGTKKKLDNNDIIRVFTDGACIMNGSVNAKAGIGIYFQEGDKRNISKRVIGKQTNNTAELSAVIEVFNILSNDIKQGKNIIVYTDSEYVIKCCTSYGEKCEKKNWNKKKGKIPNVELVKEAYTLYKKFDNIKLEWIKAHTNQTDELSIGNEGADKLANMSIGEEECPYNSPINHILKSKKEYLNVPFSKKDFAKSNGAKWDHGIKKWYYTGDLAKEKKDILNNTFG
tara:strand:+ start:145 stop:939 length:795 start_codon:yes stop_codon:yes gene_type:complete